MSQITCQSEESVRLTFRRLVSLVTLRDHSTLNDHPIEGGDELDFKQHSFRQSFLRASQRSGMEKTPHRFGMVPRTYDGKLEAVCRGLPCRLPDRLAGH